MIKDAIANIAKRRCLKLSSGVACDRNSKSIIHRILKLLFGSDVPLRCLHRSVAKQKLNLFQFASTTMAEPGASATKIVRRQIVYAGPPRTPFHRIPDYVGCYASFLSRSPSQNPSENFPLAHTRMPDPGIEKFLAPRP